MNQGNHYQVLGLVPSCTAHEIKKSYHQLALFWHPDKHTDKNVAEVNFHSINEAYNVLRDDQKRQNYDKYGHQGSNLNKNVDDFIDNPHTNGFYQKGFNGTDKSAFDILRGIFQEKEDDCLFKNYKESESSNDLLSSFKTLIQENIMSDAEETNNFCETYKPTFMNEAFSSEFTSFDQLYNNLGNFDGLDNINLFTKKTSLKFKKTKKAFVEKDEEEDIHDKEIPSFLKGSKVRRKLSFYSDIFEENDHIKKKSNKGKKNGKRGGCTVDGLDSETIRKKLKTVHDIISQDKATYQGDEFVF